MIYFLSADFMPRA